MSQHLASLTKVVSSTSLRFPFHFGLVILLLISGCQKASELSETPQPSINTVLQPATSEEIVASVTQISTATATQITIAPTAGLTSTTTTTGPVETVETAVPTGEVTGNPATGTSSGQNNNGQNTATATSSNSNTNSATNTKTKTNTDTATDTATNTLKTIGAGGAGAFTVYKTLPDGIGAIVGSDVGGIFRSADGKNFTNISQGLTSAYVADIEILTSAFGMSRVMLATKDGILISNETKTSDLARASLTWTPSNNGIAPGTGLETETLYLRYPVHEITVDPLDPSTIWIGIGLGNRLSPKLFNAPYSVYVSHDGGNTWTGVLALGSRAETYAATVYEISINPFACASDHCPEVYVATDKGLFATSNSGASWRDLGTSALMSADKGNTWATCSSPSSCGMIRFCSESAGTCLPIVESIGASKPNLRSIKFSQGADGSVSLFTAAFDNGFMNGIPGGAALCGSSTYYTDVSGDYYKGGIFRSDDGGATWRSLNRASDGSMLPTTLRCLEDSPLSYSTTSTLFTEVIAINPDQLLVSADGKKKGVFEYNAARTETSQWLDLTGDGFSSFAMHGTCAEASCFYDAATNGLWNQNDPEAVPSQLFGIDVEFDETGKVEALYSYVSRGILKGKIEDEIFRFDYLNQSGVYRSPEVTSIVTDWSALVSDLGLSDDAASDVTWESAGIDNACNYGGIEIVTDASGKQTTMLGMADHGVIHSDQGQGWQGLLGDAREPWPFTTGRDTVAMLNDQEAFKLYATVKDGSNDTNNGGVMLTEDAGKSWTSIGGECGDGCDTKGLNPEHVVVKMAIDYSTPKTSRRILAATTRGGIYAYKDGVWNQIDTCPTAVDATDILTLRDFPDYAIVTIQDGNSVGTPTSADGAFTYTTDEGVYLLKLSDLSCTRLHTPTTTHLPVLHPANVQLSQQDGQSYLVVSGEWSSWPVIYRTAFSFSAPTVTAWEITQDFYYLKDSTTGERISRTNALVKEASDNWWNYIENTAPESAWEYQDSYFNMRSFKAVWVHPKNPQLILASLGVGSPNIHGYLSQHIYISRDAGKTFTHADELDYLPLKNIIQFKYHAKDDRYFVTPACGEVVEIPELMKKLSGPK